jgi:dihydrodipicolinate reductase
MIRLAVSGAGGRMGQRILALSDKDADFELVQAIEWDGFPLMGRSVNQGMPLAPRAEGVLWTNELVEGADILIDFSSPENAVVNARRAVEYGIKLVVGTTGLSGEQSAELHEAAKSIPVMQPPNFSLGVNLMFSLAAEAARVLGDEYNIEIIEAHHNQKVDAPSGTALGLAQAVTGELHRDMDSVLVHGRHGRPGKRKPEEIGMHALRMGSLAGDHTVYFCSEHECFSISHRAESRDVFAAGALRAAKWMMRRGKPGWYTMRDMLFGD